MSVFNSMVPREWIWCHRCIYTCWQLGRDIHKWLFLLEFQGTKDAEACFALHRTKQHSIYIRIQLSRSTTAARPGYRVEKFIRPQARYRAPHLLDPFVVDLNIFRAHTPENAYREHHMNNDFNCGLNQNMFRWMQSRNIQAKKLKISTSPTM